MTKEQSRKLGPSAAIEQLAKQGELVQLITKKFTWDQAVQGTLPTNAAHVMGTLPAGALIVGGAIHVVTDVTDGDAGDNTTISFGYVGAAAAFWAATAVSVLERGKLLQLLPGAGTTTLSEAAPPTRTNVVHAEDNDSAWILLAAAVNVIMTVSNDETINAGKINIFVQYYISA